MRICFPVVLWTVMLGSSVAVEAKDITENIRWNVQRSELSITRLRLSVGPKIYKAACKSYWNSLRSGGAVHVNIIGAADELITSFDVTRDKCKS